MLEDVLSNWGAIEVSAFEVYSTMYRFGDGFLQKFGEEKGGYKANPIAYFKNESEKTGHFRIIFEDTFEELLPELQAADFCILNGLSYFGRRNLQEHASKMFAMIFDLDDVTDETLNNFLHGGVVADAYPIPNYIILSGHGVHLYYLFEEPISLFPNIKLQLKDLKYALTDRIWNPYTSTAETKQHQGINQGFRIIGGKTKSDATQEKVRAFQLNNHPFAIQQLCDYVPEANHVDLTKCFKETKLSLEEAKKKYPEWYEKVVVGKERSKKRWSIEDKVHGDNPHALYDWWKKKIREGAAYNHRYFCVMALVIYAVKCGVPYETVKADAYELIPFLNDINPQKPFTARDVDSALDCYDLRYCTFPIKDISELSAIEIKKNLRRGRSQAAHLARARAVQQVDDPEGNWRNKKGRPVGSGKEKLVKEYMASHPEDSFTAIAKALGISRTTVYKYSNFDTAVQMPKKLDLRKEVGLRSPEMSEYERMRQERYATYMSHISDGEEWIEDPEWMGYGRPPLIRKSDLLKRKKSE